MRHTRTDYHVHPDYSIDASPVRIRDYCEKALDLKLTEICFTTHIELDPARRDIDNFVVFQGERLSVFNPAWLDGYFREIAEHKKSFARQSKGKSRNRSWVLPGLRKIRRKNR